MEMTLEQKNNLYRGALTFLIILCIFFATKVLSEIRAYSMMGSTDVKTITLSGHGEVSAVPDIASIYFTIQKEAKTVKEAQDAVAVVEKQTLDFLRTNGIDEKDIKANSVSFYPKYEYLYDRQALIPCNEFGCPPRPGRNTIVGYQASESITVKVRNIDEVGRIVEGIAVVGVSDLNGPNFTIDDEEDLKAEARKLAIESAQEKAEALADDLGVRLGKISSFSESGGPFYPAMLNKVGVMAEDAVRQTALELPVGENIISSDVTITYEIR